MEILPVDAIIALCVEIVVAIVVLYRAWQLLRILPDMSIPWHCEVVSVGEAITIVQIVFYSNIIFLIGTTKFLTGVLAGNVQGDWYFWISVATDVAVQIVLVKVLNMLDAMSAHDAKVCTERSHGEERRRV